MDEEIISLEKVVNHVRELAMRFIVLTELNS